MSRIYLLLCLILLITLLGCSDHNQGEGSLTPRNGKAKVEGMNIQFTECGMGDTTLLFVHGWCIDRTYWEQQVSHFCPSYHVMAVDLPGFGKSGKNRTEWTIEAYGKDIAGLIEKKNLSNVILIGHSMGGDIILEAAAAKPEQVIGFIGVDNFKDTGIVPDSMTRAAIDQFFGMLKSDFANVVAGYANDFLFHTSTDSLIRNRILGDFAASDPEIAIPVLESLDAYSQQELPNLRELNKKIYLLNSDATPTEIFHLASSNIAFEVLNIHATGHYPMVEKPEEFNSQMEIALQKIKQD